MVQVNKIWGKKSKKKKENNKSKNIAKDVLEDVSEGSGATEDGKGVKDEASGEKVTGGDYDDNYNDAYSQDKEGNNQSRIESYHNEHLIEMVFTIWLLD